MQRGSQRGHSGGPLPEPIALQRAGRRTPLALARAGIQGLEHRGRWGCDGNRAVCSSSVDGPGALITAGRSLLCGAAKRPRRAEFRGGLTVRKSKRLGIVGISGEIKAQWQRDLTEDATVKAALLSRSAGKWYVCFQIELGLERGRSGRRSQSAGATHPL